MSGDLWHACVVNVFAQVRYGIHTLMIDTCLHRIVIQFHALEPHQVGKKGTVMSFLWRGSRLTVLREEAHTRGVLSWPNPDSVGEGPILPGFLSNHSGLEFYAWKDRKPVRIAALEDRVWTALTILMWWRKCKLYYFLNSETKNIYTKSIFELIIGLILNWISVCVWNI